MRHFRYGSRVVAGMLAFMGSQAAQAAHVIPTEYLGQTYLFDTTGGRFNPGLIVGFNPQPDPPGRPSPEIDILRNTTIEFTQALGQRFNFVLAFPGMTGLLLPAVAPPNSDGRTSFGFEYGGNSYVVGVTFAGPGPAGSWSWGAFNPQPDPPGIWESYQISFLGVDPSVTVTLSENGNLLHVALVPEPSTWAMMLIGFAALGLAGRRASLKTAALPA